MPGVRRTHELNALDKSYPAAASCERFEDFQLRLSYKHLPEIAENGVRCLHIFRCNRALPFGGRRNFIIELLGGND